MTQNPLNPRILTKPFANSSSLVDEIPDEGATPPGKPSYDRGWGNETMIPIGSGGTPPRGQSFNGVLKDLSSNILFLQRNTGYRFDPNIAVSGGYPKGSIIRPNALSNPYFYEALADATVLDFNANPDQIGVQWFRNGGRFNDWSPGKQYMPNQADIVIGSNAIPYVCVGANGIDTPAGEQNPVTSPSGLYWVTLAFYLGVLPIPTTSTTFFVRADGNDNNAGTLDDSSGAFRTLQGAFNGIHRQQAASAYPVTIRITTDGDFQNAITSADVSTISANLSIEGTGTNCIVGSNNPDTPNGIWFVGGSANQVSLGNVRVRNMWQNPNSGMWGGVLGSRGSWLSLYGNVYLDANHGTDIYNGDVGWYITVDGGAVLFTGLEKSHCSLYTTGNGKRMFRIGNQSHYYQNSGGFNTLIDFTGQTAQGLYFISTTEYSTFTRQSSAATTFVGSNSLYAYKYLLSNYSYFSTNGSGENFFPGVNGGWTNPNTFCYYA